MRETSVEFLSGNSYLVWFSSEQRFVNQIKKLKDAHPESVEIVAENLDGSLVARVPITWFRSPRPKRKRQPMSDVERQKATARLEEARKVKNSTK